MFPSLQDLIIFQGTLMMFKKILPFIFAAAAHAAPAEAVEPTYVGEPTKKLARQAARCAATLASAGEVLVDDRGDLADPRVFIDFAFGTIGQNETEPLALLQMASYHDTSLGSKDKRLQADLKACTSTLNAIRRNQAAQKIAFCVGTAYAAKHQALGIGGGDPVKIAWELRGTASRALSDARHPIAIAMAEFRALVQAGPIATQEAIQKCQDLFNAVNANIGARGTTSTGGPAVSPTGPR
jgi:hypothetical protein